MPAQRPCRNRAAQPGRRKADWGVKRSPVRIRPVHQERAGQALGVIEPKTMTRHPRGLRSGPTGSVAPSAALPIHSGAVLHPARKRVVNSE
jgi:hypothetical protein